MLFVQKRQQYLFEISGDIEVEKYMAVGSQAFVPRNIVSPAPYAASKSTWDPFFLAYFSYWQEIGSDRKQDSAAPGQSSQCLALAPEVYIIDLRIG
jgi:hypothetical protein